MNPAIYLCIFLPLILMFIEQKNIKHVLTRKIINKRKGNVKNMKELIKTYLKKDCIIYTMMNTQVTGTIESIEDNWIKIKSATTSEIVNLDYVARIREYPITKKGKRKSVVLD